MSEYDYTTVGHVTIDVLLDADGGRERERRPGGGAFYSALQAARLGLRTLVITRGRADELQELLDPYRGNPGERGELELRVLAAEQTTTLETSGMGAERRQRMLAWAGAIEEPVAVDTGILHLASVARETPARWEGRAGFVGITPQGLMRRWDERDDRGGEIWLATLERTELPERLDALVVSERERPFCERSIGPPDGAPVSAITAADAPTTVVLADGHTTQVAVPAVESPRDDLGAGDVFAAAFFIALHGGRSPERAAAYGNAAAAIRVAGEGPRAVGDDRAIAALHSR